MASPALPMFSPTSTSRVSAVPGGASPGSTYTGGAGSMFGSTPGTNQYAPTNPYAVPMPGNTAAAAPPVTSGPFTGWQTAGPTAPYKGWMPPTAPHQVPVGGEQNLGGGNLTVPTTDPALTSQMFGYLTGNIGQGLPAFQGSVNLPGGGTTAPGQLAAPLNPVEQSLQSFYQTGQGGPSGTQVLQQVAQGDITSLPEWQQMLAAWNGPQGPIAQQYADITARMGAQGLIGSSPYAQALTQYGEQTALNEQGLLGQLTLQDIGTQINTATDILSGGAQYGTQLQGLQNQAIQQYLSQYMTDLPQLNPLMQYLFAGATTSPAVIGKHGGVGAGGAAVQGVGSAIQGIADLYSALKPPADTSGGGGTSLPLPSTDPTGGGFPLPSPGSMG